MPEEATPIDDLPKMVCWVTDGYSYCPFVTEAPLESREAREEMRAHFDEYHPGKLRPTDLVEPEPGDNIPVHVYDPAAREGWDTDPPNPGSVESILGRACRKCGGPIDGAAFGSEATGWEHPFTCPEPSPWTKETPGIVEVDLPIAPIGQAWVPRSTIETDLTVDPISSTGAVPRSWVRTEDLLVNPGGWRGWLMKKLSR